MNMAYSTAWVSAWFEDFLVDLETNLDRRSLTCSNHAVETLDLRNFQNVIRMGPQATDTVAWKERDTDSQNDCRSKTEYIINKINDGLYKHFLGANIC